MKARIVEFPIRGGGSKAPTALSKETPEQLFVSLIRDARVPARVEVGAMIESYLVQLLSQSITSAGESVSAKDETFAEAYLRSQREAGGAQEATLRGIGDRALLLSGYYSESLIKKTMKPTYYHSMGKAAYAGVAGINGQSKIGSLFLELSSRFEELVRLLGEVSELGSFRREKSVAEACEKWIRTRCPSSFRLLVRRGAVPASQLSVACN